jgi:NADH dehydrogenase FAD-containing subunit
MDNSLTLTFYRALMNKVRVSVYDVAERILPGFDESLIEYATQKYQRRGISIKTGTKISSVEKTHLNLANGEKIPYGTLVWSTGVTASPLVRGIEGIERDKSQRIVTDEFLRVLNSDGTANEGCYAIGDCSVVKVCLM